MPEQSIGMATGTGAGFGDGNVGSGYASNRLTAMETKTLSDGVLQVGNLLTMSGTGTATLAIADGAAVVGGYFYENTTSSSIVISTLANATYNVVIIVNATAGSLTVSRSVAGTTVGTYSVRLAVATNAQLSGQTYVTLGTVTVSGASITAIVQSYAMYGTTSQLPYQSYATMSGGTATLTTGGTTYDVAGYSSPSVTGDNIFSVNTTTGEITVRRIGLYLVSSYGVFASGTTGNRVLIIKLNGSAAQSTRMASSGTATHTMTQTSLIVTTAVNDVISIATISTIASQTFTAGVFTITRV
jgi:ribulose-5-phosphate 4-epimerase/fuculose-1-phosphate aldolase